MHAPYGIWPPSLRFFCPCLGLLPPGGRGFAVRGNCVSVTVSFSGSSIQSSAVLVWWCRDQGRLLCLGWAGLGSWSAVSTHLYPLLVWLQPFSPVLFPHHHHHSPHSFFKPLCFPLFLLTSPSPFVHSSVAAPWQPQLDFSILHACDALLLPTQPADPLSVFLLGGRRATTA